MRKNFSDSVLEQIQHYQWPGNVREIRNFVERMVVMTPAATTDITSIPSGMLPEERLPVSYDRPSRPGPPRLNKETILAALVVCGNHRGKTAEYLGISRRQLQYKIREYHIPSRCVYESES